MGLNYFQAPDPLAPNLTATAPALLIQQLGVGLAVPFHQINNQWVFRGGVQKIVQDMFLCLRTPVGRRLWQPDFGSELPYLLFQPWRPTMVQELNTATMTALNTWVPNITVQNVNIDISNIQNNMLTLTIQFLLNGTTSSQAVVIVLTMNDQVQLDSNLFTIGGVPLFPLD